MLLMTDKKARKAHVKFCEDLAQLEQKVQEICKGKIDGKNIKVIEQIREDYKRRQGNYVINAALKIKPEIFERKPQKSIRSMTSV